MKQKIFRIILISCLFITSILFSGTACAQDEELPDPGITPDSPFYFLDKWGKSLGLVFAFGPEAKARKGLQYAEERLAEARVMAVKNRIREMTRAANDYDGFMAMVNERAEEVRRQGSPDNISEELALASTRHLTVLDRINDRVPEQAREDIFRARIASMERQRNALRELAEVRPERAIELAADTVEYRLERARLKATENATAEVDLALNYAIRISDIEEEMITLAEERGIDITRIRQRLAQANSNRLEVLAGVYEKVPDQARLAVETAIDNSVRKYERAVERLREANALGEIPEEAPALQRVRAEVKERLKLRAARRAQASANATDNITARVRAQAEIRERVREPISNLKPVLNNTDNITTESQRTQRKVSYQIPTHLVRPEHQGP